MTLGLGGLLGGLGNLVEKLTDLAQTAQEMQQSGEFEKIVEGRRVRTSYGMRVRVGLNENGSNDATHVEPVAKTRRESPAQQAPVQEVREPAVDIFEEDDHLLLIAEMPGIAAEDVQLDVQEDILTLTAAQGEKRYRKEVLLPASYPQDKMQITSNNGVVEIRCYRV
jgi:HSP20 family protein